jgi:hypothetical protein
VLSAREERTVERSIRAETHKAVTNRKEPATPRTPQSPPKGENSRSEKHTAHARTERHNDLPVTQESVRELIASSKAIKDAPSSLLVPEKHIAERKEIRQASNAAVAPVPAQEAPKQKAEKPEVRKSEGPRVHIGTVEIRAVLPQPAVPQPAVMAANYAQNIAPAQSRGRSSAAEPLARGLDWSYGLVQG